MNKRRKAGEAKMAELIRTENQLAASEKAKTEKEARV
jgi:hypothetical protein